MMNDYIWTQLYAQREAQLRATARRHGGDTAPMGSWCRRPARWFGLRLSHPVTPAQGAVGAGSPVVVPARRRAAAHPPTPAAAAWARLASGDGSLAPGTPGGTEDERDAA